MVTLLTGAAMIPHAEKANKVGEDAYFISDSGTYFGEPTLWAAGCTSFVSYPCMTRHRDTHRLCMPSTSSLRQLPYSAAVCI